MKLNQTQIKAESKKVKKSPRIATHKPVPIMLGRFPNTVNTHRK